MALDDEYESIRASLLQHSPLPTLNNAIVKVRFEETKKGIHKVQIFYIALLTPSRNQNRKVTPCNCLIGIAISMAIILALVPRFNLLAQGFFITFITFSLVLICDLTISMQDLCYNCDIIIDDEVSAEVIQLSQ